MDVQHEMSYYDRLADGAEEPGVLHPDAYARLAALFRDRVRPARGDLCIDLGCGTGTFTRVLVGIGLRVVGMDISESCLLAARALPGVGAYVRADIRAIPMRDGCADIVACSGVLHHCTAPDDRIAVLREARRVLRPGGRFFAFDPSNGSPAMLLYRHPRSPFYSSAGRTQNEVLLDRTALRNELENAGLASIEIHGAAGMTLRRLDGTRARRLLPLYNMYERILQASPAEDRFGTFLIATAERHA